MSEKFTSLLAACAVTVAVFLAAEAPAIAKDRPITVTAADERVPVRVVSYRDLNLANSQDKKILFKRVGFAVEDVCDESVPRGFHFESAVAVCRSIAWSGARPQIGRATVRARGIAKNGWSPIAPVAITISAR